MAQEMDIAGGVTEALGDDVRRQTLDERCAQGLVALLPIESRMGKEGCISHTILILYGVPNVKTYNIKTDLLLPSHQDSEVTARHQKLCLSTH